MSLPHLECSHLLHVSSRRQQHELLVYPRRVSLCQIRNENSRGNLKDFASTDLHLRCGCCPPLAGLRPNPRQAPPNFPLH